MRDERGQMMLLTAVILLLGFIALAGMMSRVSQLPEETVRERRDPTLAQIENVEEGIATLLWKANQTAPLATEPAAHEAFLVDAAAYLDQLLAARGMRAELAPACSIVGSDAVVLVAATLQRDGVQASFTVSTTYPDTACWP